MPLRRPSSRRSAAPRRRVWRVGQARRLAAALVAALAVWSIVTALRPAPPDQGPATLVATRALETGTVLTEGDLAVAHPPPELQPDRALTELADAVGRPTTRPLGRGSMLTSADLVVADLAAGLPGDLVVAHLPLASPGLAAAAVPGSQIDVLSTTDGATLARDVLVVAADAADEQEHGLFVALERADAGDVASHTVAELGGGVTVVLHPGPFESRE